MKKAIYQNRTDHGFFVKHEIPFCSPQEGNSAPLGRGVCNRGLKSSVMLNSFQHLLYEKCRDSESSSE